MDTTTLQAILQEMQELKYSNYDINLVLAIINAYNN